LLLAPSDHHFSDDATFVRYIESAYAALASKSRDDRSSL